MEIGLVVLYFLLDLFISASFLWIGMKAASAYAGVANGGTYCSYEDLLKVCIAASLVALVPYIGWVLSWAVLFYMLKKVTEAGLVEIIIMVLVSRLVALFTVPFLFTLF